MILRAGYRTFEFQEGRGIRFGSTEDALIWLKHLGLPDPGLMIRLKQLMARYSTDPEDSRLTDYQVLFTQDRGDWPGAANQFRAAAREHPVARARVSFV